jgi:small-conductance mechanosensitive channel
MELSEKALVAFLAIGLAYPLLTIVLAEIQRVLSGAGSNYARVFGQVQNLVLPCVAVYIILTEMAGINPNIGKDAMAAAEAPSIGALIAKSVLTITAIFIINTLLTALNAYLASRRGVNSILANIPGLLLDLMRLGLVLVGAALTISLVWGVNLQGALVGLGVGGIVLGLALQDTLSALFAGLSMVSTRNFKEGDWLQAGEYEGKVIAMDWRSVTIQTEQKILAVIPNSELARSTFLVESTETMPYGEEVALKFSYDDPPEQVILVIDEVVRSVPGILSEPAHRIELLYFQDNGAEYELTFFVPERGDAWQARSDFLRRFWYAAERAGLHPTGAHHALYRVVDGNKNMTQERLSALQTAQVFNPKSAGFDKLLSTASIYRFGRGEILMNHGDVVNRVLIPFRGELVVNDHNARFSQKLGVGEFFISRATLNAGKSPVRICSEGACSVLEIPQSALMEFLDKNPREAARFEALIEKTESNLTERELNVVDAYARQAS